MTPAKKHKFPVKPILSSEMNALYQIDLIDMKFQGDDQYNYSWRVETLSKPSLSRTSKPRYRELCLLCCWRITAFTQNCPKDYGWFS